MCGTGQYLPVENIKEIIEFCSRNSLLLVADEVWDVSNYEEIVKYYN